MGTSNSRATTYNKVWVVSVSVIATVLLSSIVYMLVTLGLAQGFEMTPELIKEEIQLELCINWKIENDTCSMIYAGIDGSNGEPLK